MASYGPPIITDVGGLNASLGKTDDDAAAFLRDPSTFVLGAYVDDVPIGLAWGLQMRSPSGRLTTYVHELDVQANWRRQGAGSALITEAMSVARRRGSTSTRSISSRSR